MNRKSTFRNLFFSLAAIFTAFTASAQLFVNGPFVNSPGTGPAGTDESWLFDASLAMSNYGYGSSSATSYRTGDDFVVPPGATWNIDSLYLYCYQTNAPTLTSPITAVNIRIWNDNAGAPGSTLIWGDTLTDRLVRSVWTNCYRVLESATGTSSTRAIFKNVASTSGLSLTAGTYWLDFQFSGSSSYSGPWANPITIAGNATTGNGMQESNATNPWTPALDPGSTTQQGFPFSIFGALVGIDESALVNNISIFPNPASDYLEVNVNRQAGNAVKMEIVNAIGEIVFSSEESGQATLTKRIDCSMLAAGIYFLKVNAGNETVTRKFTKI